MIEGHVTVPSIEKLAAGLAAAHQAYGTPKNVQGVGMLCVVFITQDGERNVFDQRWLEYELLEKYVYVFSQITLQW